MANDRVVIDVREEFEFSMGHAEGTINIPLSTITERIDDIKAMDNPILCCASGNRSGQAMMWLRSLGIECENGGSWQEFL